MLQSCLKYLKQKNGLPDPKGSLPDTVPSQAIARVNSEVEAELVQDILLDTSYNRS